MAGHAPTSSPPPLWPSQLRPQGGLPRPGPVWGSYPMRDAPERSTHPLIAHGQAILAAPPTPSRRQDRALLKQIALHEATWAARTPDETQTHLARLRVRLSVEGLQPEPVAEAFAAIGLAVQRQLGFTLHAVQKQAAWWMLGRRLVEMATGEGKTLTVLLTAATAALAGVPVHVMTANDYLARRDATELAPLYAALGLRVAWVTAASTPAERALAYQCDVVHVTARELAFDHLRDRTTRAAQATAGTQGMAPPASQGLVLRGLCMAIVDEADSILIDEACTPLILSRPVSQREAEQRHRLALFLARQLQQGRDFTLPGASEVRLTEAGQQRLVELSRSLGGAWRLQRHTQEQVSLALAALHGFQRDRHYLVRDGEVHIVDGHTGRLAVGRVWSRGLHQMVAIKEGLAPQADNETLTETSFQAFFPRYHALAGLSGTLTEARAELLRTYGLPVCRAPLRLPSRRQDHGTQVLATSAAKWQAVVQAAQAEAQAGRAVLIGTDTVADSETLSQALTTARLPHQLLNARQDEASGEAEQAVVRAAGQAGAITVATHMAGRGTDIHLAPEVIAAGGLHVINTHLNPSGRTDRQLIGRAARQGLPGSCQALLSWQDKPLRQALSQGWPGPVWRLGRLLPGAAQAALAAWLCRRVQQQHEAEARAQRWALRVQERLLARQLALAGRQDWD